MMIPIIVCMLKSVPKDLEKILAELKIQHWWDRLEYWQEFWRCEKTWCHSDSNEKPQTYGGVKKITRCEISNTRLSTTGWER